MTAQKTKMPRLALAVSLACLQVLVGLPLAGLSQASAQLPPPRVFVGPFKSEAVPGARLLSEKFDEATREQLKRSTKLELTDKVSKTSVTAGGADPRVDQAETLRVAGKAAFLAGDFQGALDKLRAALDLYEEGLASVAKLDAVYETLAFLGAASFKLQYDADALDYFRRVIAGLPEAEPLDELGPEAGELYREEKAKLLKKKNGSLVVVTIPPGAQVRVDGVERGLSPLTIEGLARGEHYVQAAHDEAGLGAVRTRVKGGKAARELTLTLSKDLSTKPASTLDQAMVEDMVRLTREGQLGESFHEKAEAIAAQTRASYVVVGYIAPQANEFVLKAYLYGVREKQIATFDDFKFRADLASVFVQAASFATAVEKAVTQFPFDRVVVGPVAAVQPTPTTDMVPSLAPTPKPEPGPAIAPPPHEVRPLAVGPEPEPESIFEPDQEESHWYTSWWVWTLVGTAVIGGTAFGGYVLLQDEGESDSAKARVEW